MGASVIDAGDDQNAWDLPYPCEVISIDPNDNDEWESLQYTLGREKSGSRRPQADRPFARCLEVARLNLARTIVIETRYVDLDYRSEYSAFYSKAFQRHEDSCQRLHFFSTDIDKENVYALTGPQRDSYLGYVVLRPRVRAIVGRTMLAPPPFHEAGVIRTSVRETVTFFGQSLVVKAVPFMQQDARLGSCAHVAIWMCHYSAYLGEQRVARQPVAEFSLSTDPSLGLGRILPSSGMTLHQMSDLLGRSGLAPIYYEISGLNDEDRPHGQEWLRQPKDREAQVSRVCCRYLNSGLPVIAVVRHANGPADVEPNYANAAMHAIVICGYFREGDQIRMVAHDDRRGPYMTYHSVTNDYDPLWSEHCSWEHVLAPVPQKLWLTGEAAERAGSESLIAGAREAVAKGVQASRIIVERFSEGNLSFRTYAITGNRFKRRIAEYVTDPVILRAYREARLPHYVWVVEAVDRTERNKGATACVLGEVIMDATSDERKPSVLATRFPGIIAIARPDDAKWNKLTKFAAHRPSCGQYSA
jgi:hypothetical protein